MQQQYRYFYTSLYHFLDFSFGGGFLGMRKSALMGCMSHRAAKETQIMEGCMSPLWLHFLSKHLHFQHHSICPRTPPGANQIHTTAKKSSVWVHRDFKLKEIQKKGCKARTSTTFFIFSIYIALEGHKKLTFPIYKSVFAQKQKLKLRLKYLSRYYVWLLVSDKL